MRGLQSARMRQHSGRHLARALKIDSLSENSGCLMIYSRLGSREAGPLLMNRQALNWGWLG